MLNDNGCLDKLFIHLTKNVVNLGALRHVIGNAIKDRQCNKSTFSLSNNRFLCSQVD